MLVRQRDSWLPRRRDARPDHDVRPSRATRFVTPDGFDPFEGTVPRALRAANAPERGARPAESTPVLVLTFRRVPVHEETLQYVRRCCRRAQAELTLGVGLVDVVVERCEDGTVAASITLGTPPELRVEDRDLDELIAIQNAFARLHALRA